MAAVRLHGRITEDRRLVVELPPDIAPGAVEIELFPQAVAPTVAADPDDHQAELDALRARLLAAGVIVHIKAPEGAVMLSDEERAILWSQVADGKTVQELIDEEREERF